MVMTEAAREALDGILVAAWYDKRFGDLGTAAASVLAMLLRLYAHEGRPPSAKEIAAATGFTELETARLLTALSQHDLVILERDGAAIRGAYPFTQSATEHSLRSCGANAPSTPCAPSMRSALVPCAARILSSAQAAIYVVCLLLLRRGTGAWRSTRSVAIGRRMDGFPCVPRLRGRLPLHCTRLLLLRRTPRSVARIRQNQRWTPVVRRRSLSGRQVALCRPRVAGGG